MNLRTLEDMKKENSNDKSKKNTASYTGGQSSGMAVQNPDVNDIMKKAQKNSQSVDEYEKSEKQKDGSVCKITIYNNGFIVQDGEFQDHENPRSKQFMKELNKGLIPKSLRQKYPKGGLSISLSDKTSEKYTPPPPPAYIAFSGQGACLSGQTKPPTKFAKKSKPQSNFILEPDRKKQVTSLRVRLSDGSTITIQANLDTSLQLVYNHIETLSGVGNFELFGGFPPKPLDMQSTVQKSDLADATLIQK